jgi:tRNA dimethylallyltransferase
MPRPSKPVFFVIGTTGSGKSDVAIRIAQELKSGYRYKNVVVINCDVYQCFNALPICTNKPSRENLGNVPHAFFGFLESDGRVCNAVTCSSPEEEAARTEALDTLKKGELFNVHTYEKMVTAFISTYFRLHDEAAVIVCGGTCYYVQALLFCNTLVNVSDAVSRDGDNSSDGGNENLWERLNAVDPDVASRYHPNDSRRIKRMLEIHKHTGRKPSAVFGETETELRFDSNRVFVVWTQKERVALDRSLDGRVDEMLRRGMLREAQAFWSDYKGSPPHSSLSEAIGCKEFLHLFADRGLSQLTEEELNGVTEQVKANTRRYARQQDRWIKNRLVRLLALSPLKEQWTHFIAFPTDEGSNALCNIGKALQTLFASSIDSSTTGSGFHFPIKDTLATRHPVCQEKCDICGLLVYGREPMEQHFKSRRHRGALRRIALEKEQREVYGRELPPPKRKRGT